MNEVLTSAEMRAHEKAVIESGAVTGLGLMEKAGQGVVEAVFESWPEFASGGHRAVVLCGPGNNGGDGYVVARLLKNRGWDAQVFALGSTENLPPDAKANALRWIDLGPVRPLDQVAFDPKAAPDLIVDALFGTGLTRPLDPPLVAVIERYVNAPAPRGGTRVVAVDIPSGLCADSGRSLGASVRADLTVIFHSEKPGHLLAEGGISCSKNVVVKDIGLPPFQSTNGDVAGIFRNALPAPAVLAKDGGRHKYDYGHAVVISGPAAHTGAARLAARGALRIGAGLVSLATRSDALSEVAAQSTAVMVVPIEGASALHARFAEDARANAFCLGPALGKDAVAAELIRTTLALRRATVLDADALTLLAEEPEMFADLHPGCVLTPHGGEFSRLFPDIAERLAADPTQGPAYSKIDATRAAAERAGCVVLFKGADTVMADPRGRCIVNALEEGAAWLATAGSGDVLAGFICGLLARGLPPLEAAATGAKLHAACARAFGPGLIAEDLPEVLPKVFRSLGL
ncbi:NAD(P)H-hydrate dehydratase [uncultured Roseobacter sp.]|uniref:NAD(P)H-hydrate dehydratase n=1 Tax=uncultured Roseobacter sp. TaxID=114847 RepID=UPI002609A906|nr:NAD(P)H-hydrate dehydratase [uncultured Roseobacter sp.]